MRTEPRVIDSHAWVEYFRGKEDSRALTRMMEEGEVQTPSLVLSEVGYAIVRGGGDPAPALRFIQARSRVVPLTPDIALLAVEVHRERRKKKRDWPMADSVVLATARHLGGRVVTGDPHFDDLGEEVVLLK